MSDNCIATESGTVLRKPVTLDKLEAYSDIQS